ncbi:hypothetical protein HXX76_000200 [Chlamydomonas incerta]|uniref:Zinc finger LSD1-type domain-containing protein n=1 Tax=Chlamydomonas incerta TaxID=51695 RepID=A0A835WDW7_CHLIN|nr:hypothetical protein HXX76_000200 [Chlamydomonas incerta]|eukprot:KAG2445588.1 hypothetical protein HXX76_000200 [Chlamydomonas incerta]
MSMWMPPGGAGSMAPPSQSHLVCGGCRCLLMYPQGASNVRCSRCGHITSAPASAGADSSQIVCNGCRVLLSYPRGAQSVQCSLCHAVTQVPVYGHLVCNGCSIMLMYPMGAQSVKCSVCHYVTPVTAATAAAGGASGSIPAARPKTTQTVVVENPPSYDEKGNEVANIAVGVKADT